MTKRSIMFWSSFLMVSGALLMSCAEDDEGPGPKVKEKKCAQECGADSYCLDGVCEKMSPTGGTCIRNAQCPSKICFGGVCACDSANTCSDTEYCSADNDDIYKTCKARKEIGDECSAGSECLTNSCVNEKCGCRSNDDCANGYACVTSQCVLKPKDVGESCSVNSECDSEKCSGGVCVCQKTEDCGDGEICKNNQCTTEGVVDCPDKSGKKCILAVDVDPNKNWYYGVRMSNVYGDRENGEKDVYSGDIDVTLPSSESNIMFCAFGLENLVYWNFNDATVLDVINILMSHTVNSDGVMTESESQNYNAYFASILKDYQSDSLLKTEEVNNKSTDESGKEVVKTGLRHVLNLDAPFIKCLNNSKVLNCKMLELSGKCQETVLEAISQDECLDALQAAYTDEKDLASDNKEKRIKAASDVIFSVLKRIPDFPLDSRIRSRSVIGCIEIPIDEQFTFDFKYNENSAFKGHDTVNVFTLDGSSLNSSTFKLSITQDYNTETYEAENRIQPDSENVSFMIPYKMSHKLNNDDSYKIAFKSTAGHAVNCSDYYIAKGYCPKDATASISGNMCGYASKNVPKCVADEGCSCDAKGAPIQNLNINGCNSDNPDLEKYYPQCKIVAPVNIVNMKVYVVLN